MGNRRTANCVEINTHLVLLSGDALPLPGLHRVQMICSRFLRIWRGVWARFGDTDAGPPHHRQALQAFIEETRVAAGSLILANELHWYNAMMSLIGKVAVRSELASNEDSHAHGIDDRA